MQVFCCVVLAVSLVAGLRAESGKRAMRLMLVDDGTLLCESSPRDGRYRLENGAVDFGWAVWVRLRAESGDPAPESSLRGRRWSLMLIRSNVGAECWRGLRTWLRHKAYRSPGG
ncbi:hypothetical protein CCZ27_07230 [Thauera sinica]|nr:hypothetical protein CCZ27_07230 [Thauera sp. K11]